MVKIILFICCFLACCNSYAETPTATKNNNTAVSAAKNNKVNNNVDSDMEDDDEDEVFIRRPNIISADELAKIQSPENSNIQLMLDNYNDAELRSYALSINDAEIREAKELNKPIPAKLTDEVLNSREKIGEYLRSRYDLAQ